MQWYEKITWPGFIFTIVIICLMVGVFLIIPRESCKDGVMYYNDAHGYPSAVQIDPSGKPKLCPVPSEEGPGG